MTALLLAIALLNSHLPDVDRLAVPAHHPHAATVMRGALRGAARSRNPLRAHPRPPRTARQGLATWYAAPIGTAAAGPVLRRALGAGWRGRIVYANGVRLVLRDWCACGPRHGVPTLLDIAAGSFPAPLSRGVVTVTVRW